MIETINDLLIAGFSVIPVKKDKKPALKTWKQYQNNCINYSEIDACFSKAHGVAIVCGKVSGGVEVLDFDASGGDASEIYQKWCEVPEISAIIKRHKLYIEKTPRKGIHVIFRYMSDKYTGNQRLAVWENGTSMIETRSEGGYCVIAPTKNYNVVQGDILNLPTLTLEERDCLINFARDFTAKISQASHTNVDNNHHIIDPVSWYNWNKAAHVKKILEDQGWKMRTSNDDDDIEHWTRPGKDNGTSATWGKKHNSLYVFSSSIPELHPNTYYTPFQLLCIFKFSGKYWDAIWWVVNKYFPADISEYIRVGCDYFKIIKKIDRYGTEYRELKAWKKAEIIQDYGRGILKSIPLFDDFILVPSNINHEPIINNCYNLYFPIPHEPKKNSIYWTNVLMEHIFGEQIELGYRYMQILYLHPEKITPILVLVSKQRQTGKTTFINYLNMLFGSNVANVDADKITKSFNFIFGIANIITIEETLIEKNITVEKLKALSTQKFITINEKWVSEFKLPFYGKIIITSNNEDKFARVDEEEIRFFVRKLKVPQITNHNIEADLLSEIPAFLYYLKNLPAVDFTKDRTGFLPQEIENEPLKIVKSESKSCLYKELRELITDLFSNNSEMRHFYATPVDIKFKWFHTNSNTQIQHIRNALKNEYNYKPAAELIRYVPFETSTALVTRVGRPYIFMRDEFINLPAIPLEDEPPF